MHNRIQSVTVWTRTVLFLICASMAAVTASAQEDDWPPVLDNEIFDLPEHQNQWTFRELVGETALRVDGMANRMTLGFGSRMDQITTGGALYLTYSYSPTLIRDTSQLRIRLNGELLRAVRLPVAQSDQRHQLRIDLPAEYFDRYNEIEFELLAETMGAECAVVSPAAWLEFSGDSRIEVQRRQLLVTNDLSWFPEPFFDERDFSRLHVHYLFPDDSGREYIAAMGLLSSYFGKVANWRSLEPHLYRYPSHVEREHEVRPWPNHHAIVLMTNDERPWLLRDMPAVDGPTIRMITNPVNQAYKMLLVQAPERAGLITAVQGLIEHPAGMSGPELVVRNVNVAPREPYSAPRWISTQRPVTFSELVDFETDLQRSGYRNSPIGLNLRLPPDLFTWQRHGIPIDLKFRYTPPIQVDESRLRVFVNNEFIKGYTLTESGLGGVNQRIRVPLLENNPFAQPTLQIPAFKLGAINRLDFEFSFSSHSEECRVRPIGNTMGAIDGDSKIDLRGYEHYTQLPNLQLFVKTGYPFSVYDDLSNTLLVMSREPSDTEMRAAMTTLGMIGSATGHHGSLLRVRYVDELTRNNNEDLLIIGGNTLREFLSRFGRSTLDQQLRHHGLSGQQSLLFSPEESVQISGPSAALVSFESPIQRNATVVALTANQDEFLGQVESLIRSAERNTDVVGFMTVITPGSERHLNTYDPYYVGELSFWKRMHFHLSRYPVLVSVITLVALITLVLILYWFFASIARRRVGGSK
ncbi:cellulose biosynthesis cyclic di-GMP-binding regulatory protein BcsB [Aliidiomarina indica]|uniref:cellulose biosynthesis cyclic di-GMP-binding regulatory protein BcsB n=1 Tax=Aliidiomarina indica TaxID=2749147 RepID=UPI00188E3432|nr:cellulose biosynthesis cyclic di-GMP-binding regulatory protein BcsB [Aliidiomarina indica]